MEVDSAQKDNPSDRDSDNICSKEDVQRSPLHTPTKARLQNSSPITPSKRKGLEEQTSLLTSRRKLLLTEDSGESSDFVQNWLIVPEQEHNIASILDNSLHTHEIDNPLATAFEDAVAIGSSACPLVTIEELASSVVQPPFSLRAKILNKYGNALSKRSKEYKYLKVDLADSENTSQTITLVVGPPLDPSAYVSLLNIQSFIQISDVDVHDRSEYECGTLDIALLVKSSTTIEPCESFPVSVKFMPVKSVQQVIADAPLDKTSYCNFPLALVVLKENPVNPHDKRTIGNFTVIDGPTNSDKTTLYFQESREEAFQKVSASAKSSSFYAFVLKNFSVFKTSRTASISVIDSSLFTLVPRNRLLPLRQHFDRQIATLGLRREDFGRLQITSVNNFKPRNACETYKALQILKTHQGYHCFVCEQSTRVIQVPYLLGTFTVRDGTEYPTSLVGDIVDRVLQLPQPFLRFLKNDPDSLQQYLADFSKYGQFRLDNSGQLLDFKPAKQT